MYPWTTSAAPPFKVARQNDGGPKSGSGAVPAVQLAPYMVACQVSSGGYALFTDRAISSEETSARRLPMAADSFAVVRPRRTLGIAIAAKSAMIATTIMISTSVKTRSDRFILTFLLFYFG